MRQVAGKKASSRGFSLVELMMVAAIVLIMVMIAVPSWIHGRMSSDETSAVGSLRSINTACQEYSTTYGTGFPTTLAAMGPSTTPSSGAADLLDSVLASGIKSGYSIAYTPGPPDSRGVISSYTVTAVPESRGSTGQRGFFSDQTFVIRADESGLATANDPPIS